VQDRWHLADAGCDEVVRHEVGQLLKPPHRQSGQHGALVRHDRRKDDVVRRQPVAGDQQDVLVVDGVDIADLAAGEQREGERHPPHSVRRVPKPGPG